ncbi:MAG: glycogen debranching protein GlgX [Proteobacteria bacterium]|nr:glycogen debranching protein GlgX [Pseudomonadota bacterium]
MGTSVTDSGVNFALFTRDATGVTLVVYESDRDEMPLFTHELNSKINQTGDIWHCFVKNLKEGHWYGYFVNGIYDPKGGRRFNPNKLLIDPHARAVVLNNPLQIPEMYAYDRKSPLADLSFSDLRSDRVAPRACIIRSQPNEGVRHKRRKLKDHIIYEMHVKGFSFNKNSGVKYPGTFRGVMEKIPYLKELGITAVELLPIHAFDDQSIVRHNPDGKALKNYWGYDPVSFSSIHLAYSSFREIREAIKEFKEMVNALHDAGIEVILDVVFNHTAEGNELGPTFSFKGIDNSIYYMLDNGRNYKNYTGCGNTLNFSHPVVRDLVVDSLLYWVVEMGVDGFRFDLASVFSRDAQGNIIPNAPLVEKIAEHPVLRDVIMIAEAWDAAGAYQVGKFGGARWAEWNGKFRDDLRSFIKADIGSLANIAERLTGSPSMFLSSSKFPSNSINFVTCHDGFTLYDLVSYNKKHNLANGENNEDGYNDNRSWNWGIEGDTSDEKIKKLRLKQMKNAMALTMLSLGVPMINSGDEFCKTQKGNNNAYCQDSEISWLDWSLFEKNKDFFRFVKNIIGFRKNNTSLRRRHFYNVPEGADLEKFRDLTWYGEKGEEPNWKPDNYTIAFLIKGWTPIESSSERKCHDIFVIVNSHWEPHCYILPKIKDKKWHFICDTDKEAPNDIVDSDPGKSPILDNQNDYTIQPRSVVILISKEVNTEKR